MGRKRQRYSIWYRYIHRQMNICILYCIYCRYLDMASVQNRWRLEINTYLIKLQIIFNFYICWLSYSATGCRQITVCHMSVHRLWHLLHPIQVVQVLTCNKRELSVNFSPYKTSWHYTWLHWWQECNWYVLYKMDKIAFRRRVWSYSIYLEWAAIAMHQGVGGFIRKQKISIVFKNLEMPSWPNTSFSVDFRE